MGDNSRSFYTASPVHACFVLRDCLQRGLAPEPLFAGTQLTRAKLESGNAIIVGDFLRLLENARQYTGDETLGLMIGRHTNTAALGPVGAAAATAPTVRDGLQVMESFARLHVTYVRIALVSSLHCLSVRFRYLLPLGETERFHCETAVLFIQNYVEMLTGLTLDNAQYCFSFANPGYPQAYQRCMHSALSFDQEHTAVDIPHQWLDLRSPYFDAETWNQAQFHLAQRIKEQSAQTDNTFTQHITALLHSFEPPLPALRTILDRLHLSERTLNRRLQLEGASFRDIKAGVLQYWARLYLAETDLTVEAIGAALGYQDAANFRRAFRKREGCSPGEFRKSGGQNRDSQGSPNV